MEDKNLEWKKTQCSFCAVSCGIEVQVEDGHIVNVRPDKDSPRSHGYCCRKGRSAKYFVDQPDRIEYPMKRVGDKFERISWEQAYREIAERTHQIVDEHGPRSVAVFSGTAGLQTPSITGGALRAGIGTQYSFNAIGVEFMGAWWSLGRLIGDQGHMFEPDDKKTDVMIFWGGNAYVSHQIIDAREIIREFSENPDKMVITVDPRLSETARMSDMHIMPKPGSDTLMLRALIALIVENGWENRDFLDRYAADWDKAKKWFEQVDIDACLKVCGVPRAQLTEFARILTTKKWGIHQDLGLYFGRHSTASSYLCYLLMIVCGMFLVEGGNTPCEIVYPRGKTVDEYDPQIWKTPVKGRFPVLGTFPAGVFPDEVLGDNEDRIRMVFSCTTNVARSYSGSKMMEKALEALELYVAIDHTWVESMKYADYVLPSKNMYESDGDINAFHFNFPEAVLHFRRKVLPGRGEAKEASQIYAEITQAMGYVPELPDFLYKAAEQAVETGDRMTYFATLMNWIQNGNQQYKSQITTIVALTLGKAWGSAGLAVAWIGFVAGALLGDPLVEAEPTLEKYPILKVAPDLRPHCKMDAAFQQALDHPEGVIVGYVDRDTMLDKYIKHEDKKLHLWCREIEEYLERITPEKEEKALQLTDGCNMILSAGRHSEDGANNSMRDPKTYQYHQPFTLAMNPEDAKEFGFIEGQEVRVSTKTGSLTIPVECSWQVSRGYCLIPHHFGLTVGGEKYGESVNMLTSHEDMEEMTGNATWRYTPCRVEALDANE